MSATPDHDTRAAQRPMSAPVVGAGSAGTTVGSILTTPASTTIDRRLLVSNCSTAGILGVCIVPKGTAVTGLTTSSLTSVFLIPPGSVVPFSLTNQDVAFVASANGTLYSYCYDDVGT